jgi:LysM repeat protein
MITNKLKSLTGTSSQTSSKTYTVKQGDTLWKIASQQLGAGYRYSEIKKLNGLKSDIIRPG